MENHSKKSVKKAGDAPLRRSSRIHNQAKPNPGLVAAKKNAQMRWGHKKQPVFSFVPDIYQVARDSKDCVRISTGVVYAEKFAEHKCLWDENHPECPERFNAVLRRCGELGLLNRCSIIQPCSVAEAQLIALHTPELISLLKSTNNCNDLNHLENLASQYDSIYFHPSTYDCSLLAAGCTIKLVDEICKRNIQNGMAIVRPPGHHAEKNDFCGYCYFNNVALAANHALNIGIKKVLIVDWDVHHGQATQQMFYEDNRVLYFSIHRYEHGTFWPNLRESDFDSIGEGLGRGFNFNVPLNATGMRDNDYMAIWHQLLLPVAYEFNPELVLISAGYDAAIGCAEGEMELTPAVYSHLLTSLMCLANGKVAVVLEGGYYIKSLAEAAAMTLRALLGDPCPGIGSLGPPSEIMEDSIMNVIYVQRAYWKSLRHQKLYSILEPPEEDEQRHMPSLKYLHDGIKPTKYPTRDGYPVSTPSFLHYVAINLNNIIASTKLLKPEHKVCLVYDAKMMDHKNYEDKNHIEQPARISSIYKFLEDFGLLKRLHILKSRYCTDEELKYAHNESHIVEMSSLNKMTIKQLIEKKEIYQSVYFHQDTYQAACLAAGSLLEVVDSVMKGESCSGVAVIRPPGHHADIDDPCGFCIFNSVAIAARHAIKQYGLKRVLIVDWDIHHGNGTQEIFFEDSNVLYMSVHRFDGGEFFPHNGDGAASLVGRGEGEGFTVNIPWNKGNMGNAEYVAAFSQVILPIAYEYDPELVLVSAGFDAAVGDPLGGCKVSPEAFGHMTYWLSPLANGRLILSLEGGYNINSISYSMTMCTKALLGDPLPRLNDGLAPCQSAIDSINETLSVHHIYWSTLKPRIKSLPAENVLTEEKKRSSRNPPSLSSNILQQNTNGQKNEVNLLCEGQLFQELSLSEETNKVPVDADNEKNDDRSNDDQHQPPSSQPSASSTNSSQSSSEASNRPTLRQFLSDNLQALVNEEMFAVVPKRTCPHLPLVEPIPKTGINVQTPCSVCNDPKENWICLICYTVQCGRYINEHMMMHNAESGHPLVLSFSDLSVWCYPCQSYIDNQVLYEAKNAAHLSKFGTELAWSYGTVQVNLS
ncbi:hypothetical protein O3M35_009261 [Rhynocoris fuscipes]|uniref:Protein deacetylase HDAC6 n=1 Tax=Rhynocoris fuscipes TaxID=488301 RepID=A0AAW1D283_9HEMI